MALVACAGCHCAGRDEDRGRKRAGGHDEGRSPDKEDRSFWDFERGWQQTRTGEQPPPPPDARNLVLVMSCTTRRDQLSPYGAPPEVTPYLSRLARQGVRFDDAIAAAPWTKAASTALLTGHHPVSIGMVEPASKRDQLVLPESVRTLAERLDAAGWRTVGATGNPNLNTPFGLSRGFEAWHDSLGAVHADPRSGANIARDLLKQVERDQDGRPLYLQVMLVDTHEPRNVTDKERQVFEAPGISTLMATYRASLHQTDDAVRLLDQGLHDLGYTAENTWFVFVADHGEGLNEPAHHNQSHGTTLYPSIVRIPLLIRGPGAPPGHVAAGLASGVDLVPTLLSVLGQPLPAGLEGEDMSAQVRGAPSTTRQTAWSDSWFQQVNRASVWTSDRQCQLDFGTSRFRGDSHVDGCFDRVADPDFYTTIPGKPLLDQLRAWRKEKERERRAAGQLGEATLDEATVEQLRTLGYHD